MAEIKTGTAFIPKIGRCYEIHFGIIKVGDKEGHGSARIRATGAHPSQWEDLDTGEVLDPRFAAYIVQGFKEIDCPVP